MQLPKELTTVTPLSKNIALVMFTLLPIIAFLLGMKYQANLADYQSVTPQEKTACTMDAKICPDGSFVGRTGPNCEFAPCPIVEDENKNKIFCGGIRGITCPTGYECQFEGNYPDAGGNCVKKIAYPTPSESSQCCPDELLLKGYKCAKKCGSPVVRENDPDPGYSCLSPEQYESRSKFGCPICLSSSTLISTPQGEINVKDIRIGTEVWTTNIKGEKIVQPVIRISSVAVPKNHKLVHLKLQDGRSLKVSPGHNTTEERRVGQLEEGDWYDGSLIVKKELIAYEDLRTYDLLPGGDTGFYFANQILIGSTLK